MKTRSISFALLSRSGTFGLVSHVACADCRSRKIAYLGRSVKIFQSSASLNAGCSNDPSHRKNYLTVSSCVRQ
jgi:hypothetical protein